jgi:nucleoside 2-deoxyribosyltransferase
MNKRIYIAGPLFNSHERYYLEQVAIALENQNFSTFLPHRDVGLLGDLKSEAEKLRIFRQDMEALKTCDILVAILTGSDHDSGTCAELGYAYSQDKPCFGLSDDFRGVNNFIWGLCGEGKLIARTIEDLLRLLEETNLLTTKD